MRRLRDASARPSDVVAQGERDGLQTGVAVQLAQDVLDVVASGRRGYEQLIGDLLGAQPFGEQSENISLPEGELIDHRCVHLASLPLAQPLDERLFELRGNSGRSHEMDPATSLVRSRGDKDSRET